MEKVLLCYEYHCKQKGAKYETKCLKNQTETERIRKEEEEGRGKRGIFNFSLLFVSSLFLFFLFFSFFNCFRRGQTSFSNVFFLKGGFVQITCAISLHLGARALSSDDTLPERERGKDEQHQRVLRGKRRWWWWSWSARGCKHILPCVSDAVLFSPIAYFAAPSRS